MSEIERRFFDIQHLEIRADDAKRTISGYAAVFDSLSQVMWGFRERIAPGAFADTLDDDIRALWNHDTGIVLGRTTSGTLRLKEDDHGLRVEIDAPQSAEQQVEAIERGDVNQMSFGFRALDFEWDEDDEGTMIRTLNKAKLYEVSPVTFPAYTSTSVGVRSHSLFGEIPQIPAEYRQEPAPDKDAERRRALLAVQKRRLNLMTRG